MNQPVQWNVIQVLNVAHLPNKFQVLNNMTDRQATHPNTMGDSEIDHYYPFIKPTTKPGSFVNLAGGSGPCYFSKKKGAGATKHIDQKATLSLATRSTM